MKQPKLSIPPSYSCRRQTRRQLGAVARRREAAALFIALLVVSCSKPTTRPDTSSKSSASPAALEGSPRAIDSGSAAPKTAHALLPVAEHDAPLSGPLLSPEPIAPGDARPLLVFLHGLGGSGSSSVQALGLARLAHEQHVFVYAPDGASDSVGRKFWNAHPACCNFDGKRVDDVAQLKRTIEELAERPDIDAKRVYVMGHSNGAFMALRLACEMGDRLAAVASVAGAGPADDLPCHLSSPLHVLMVHGNRDSIVRYEGGTVFDAPDRPRHESARETFAGWARRLQCSNQLVRARSLDLDQRLPGAETRVERYQKCALGSTELWTVSGGSHFIISSPELLKQIWEFFTAHSTT